ncbi:MAG: hypothetical protein ABI862_21515 [Ilumatobacteraceae bacterium]
MLTDRIVVKSEMLGQLGDINRPRRVGDVPKEFVTRWITESPGLQLQRAHRAPTALSTASANSRTTTAAMSTFAFSAG